MILRVVVFAVTVAFAADAHAQPMPQPRPPSLEAAKPAPAPKAPAPEAPAPGPSPAKDDEPLEPAAKDLGPHPPRPGLVEAEVPTDPLPDKDCDELEQSAEVEFKRLPRIMEGQCGALTPISVSALVPKDGQKVTLEPPATVTCRIAKAALGWLTSSVQPAAQKHLGSTVRTFSQAGGYECRGRNRDPKAQLSEHGSANALDIGGFALLSGNVLAVSTQDGAERAFLDEVRASACGPFTTVLGPGVAAHEDHLHLDLAKRGKKGRHATYCR